MKKFRILIAAFSIIYLITAVILIYVIKASEKNINNEYRVEINRIKTDFTESYSDTMKQDNSIININEQNYSYAEHVYNIMFMSYTTDDTKVIEHFYEQDNRYQMEIVPVIIQDKVKGYLRFNYEKKVSFTSVLIAAEVILFFMYIIAAGILLYINYRIIRPFNKMSLMPYELSKGNLNSELEESKNRYFGKFIWGLGMLKDTLDTHRQKELKLAKDKKMLVLSVSHDIKTPLNAINLYAKALENNMYDTEDEYKNAAVKIQEKTAEINEFVSELIKSSTEEVVTIDVADSEYYLRDLITKVDKGYVAKCELMNIRLKVDLYENLLIKGDIDRMYEAIGNLIENAMKYGDGKSINITFSVEEGYLLIHVINTGTPVAENEVSHIFESFYRGGNSEGKKGNGLGLYICREIMRKMNGDIYAVSRDEGMEIVLVCRMC